jgi:hypothetical protein
MGDILKRVCDYGGFAPYEYKWPESWEGKVLSFEDDFPTADKMRNRKQKLNTADRVILDEIKRTLEETTGDVSQILYEGDLTSTVVKYLCDKGYKVEHIRSLDNPYTKISWRE